MKTGWSKRIREIADREYVGPARRNGGIVRIVVGDIHRKLKAEGFPSGYTNQICTSLEAKKFWRERGLQMRSPVGQPRRHSTTFEYRFQDSVPSKEKAAASDPLLELMGIMKGAIREGADAFLHELRKDKERNK